MAENSTFYFVCQSNFNNKITITRISRARVFETALRRSFDMIPYNTRPFMVVEETELNKVAEDIKKATRHLIGEK